MNVEIIRSKRKTVAIQVTDNMQVVVRVPQKYPDGRIRELIADNSEWIEKSLIRIQTKKENYPDPTPEEAEALRLKAENIIPDRVNYFSKITGLSPNGIKITDAKTRFGSCSGKNSLCFSLRLMQYSEQYIDYVVLHEIAHIKYHNHGKEFYEFIKKIMPDYKEREKILKG